MNDLKPAAYIVRHPEMPESLVYELGVLDSNDFGAQVIPLYAIPEGCVVVSKQHIEGILEYADGLLHQVNKLLSYSGSIADDQEHDDSDYAELRALLGKEGDV